MSFLQRDSQWFIVTWKEELDIFFRFLRNEEQMPEHLGAQSAVERISMLPIDQLIAESGKMKFLVELLDNLKAEGHRTLVFSMARRILDIVERVMTERVCIILNRGSRTDLKPPHDNNERSIQFRVMKLLA